MRTTLKNRITRVSHSIRGMSVQDEPGWGMTLHFLHFASLDTNTDYNILFQYNEQSF
jgi:hypothetical protein